MAAARDNCIILLVDPPVPERVSPKLNCAFGEERAVHIHLDLLQNAYRLVKNFGQAIPILAYEKSAGHPDLTWLDADDPGFLDTKGRRPEEGILNVFRLAFNTGARKALLLNHLAPEVGPERLQEALDSVGDRTVVLGPAAGGSAYLVGLTVSGLRLLEDFTFSAAGAADALADRARKAKLSVVMLPEARPVESEEALRAWLDSKDPAAPLFAKKHGRRGGRQSPDPAKPGPAGPSV